MGIHACIFPHEELCAFSVGSSGDVTMVFSSGRVWEAPDMLTHYVYDQGWIPPVDFVNDVMHSTLVDGVRMQTKSPMLPKQVGYLDAGAVFNTPAPEGYDVEKFVLKLMKVMREADRLGNRRQTRGA